MEIIISDIYIATWPNFTMAAISFLYKFPIAKIKT